MKAIIFLTILVAALLLAACLITPTPPPTTTPTPVAAPTIEIANTPTPALLSTPTPQVAQSAAGRAFKQYAQPPLMTVNPDHTYSATLVTNLGNITIELFVSEAPVTVNNFVFLAREGFYDGVTFHRVMKGFMIQTGDPLGDGTGGPGYQFDDEPVNRSYTRAIVAMANAGADTNGSQFFIVQGDNVNLQPDYTIFGQVTDGMAVVDEIAGVPVGPNALGELSAPVEPVVVERVEINETP